MLCLLPCLLPRTAKLLSDTCKFFNSSGPRGDMSPSHFFISHHSLTNMAASEDLPWTWTCVGACPVSTTLQKHDVRIGPTNTLWARRETMCVCFGWHCKFMLFILTLKSICILPLLQPPLNSTLEDSFSCFPVRTGIPNRLWLIRLLIFKN